MELECRRRFVLLDLGHPMKSTTINNITYSLQNVLTLGLTFSGSFKKIKFGISILNSDFAIFLLQSRLGKTFDSITKDLNATVKGTKPNSRVTVQQYKYLLFSSVEAIFQELQKFEKKSNQSNSSLIQIALITQKTGSILVELLADVINKLQKNIPNITLAQNFKIVQILNEHWNFFKGFKKNTSIDCISCSDKLYDLSCFFKDWLLNPQQRLEILLSKDLNLKIKCEVENCVINPVSVILDKKFDLFNDIQSVGSKNFSAEKWEYKLEIISRLPVHGLDLSLMYGIPRRIYSEWAESQTNFKIFKQLCRELSETRQGLLAKSALPTGKEEISMFYFVTSDGDTLLVNNVAPEELFLHSFTRLPEHVHSSEDENEASTIKNCFEKIELLNEYNPKYFSSGLYEYLKNYLIQEEKSKSLNGHFREKLKLFGKNCAKTKKTLESKNPAAEKLKKRQKISSKTKLRNIHPALLSPSSQNKYRKIPSEAFNLPELRKDYNDNLT